MDAYLLNETLISSSFSVYNLNEVETLLKWKMNYFYLFATKGAYLIKFFSFKN